MSWFPQLCTWLSLRLVAVWARLVPQGVRGRWHREWNAEIAFRSKAPIGVSEPHDALDVLGRSLGAGVDAWYLRKEDWGFHMIKQEVQYAIRRLFRMPLFTGLAVLTLGLGIGANTAVFSVIRNVVLRPLPFEDPDRLVTLAEQNLERGWPAFSVAPANFLDWKDQAESFIDLSAMVSGRMTVTGFGSPERLSGTEVTPTFFSILGVTTFAGRTFTASDDEPGRGNVVILSHGLWQRLFGGRLDAVGQSMTLDGTPYEIVGVMPASMNYPESAEMWMPMVLGSEPSRGAHYLRVIGRLARDTDMSSARAEMSSIAAALGDAYPGSNRGWGARVDDFRDGVLGGRITTTLYVLWAAVGLVILMACVNLTNLFLARTSGQRVEFAVRSALGASRRRLIRQVFVESALVASLGLLLGLGLGALGVQLLIGLDPASVPRLQEVRIDAFVLGVSGTLTIGVAFIVGLASVLHGTRVGLFAAVRSASGAGGFAASHQLRRLLVVLQVAVAVVVVVGSGVVMRSLWNLQAVDPGFTADRVAVFQLSPPSERYPDYPQLRALHDRLLGDLSALPDVESAGLTNLLPLRGDLRFAFRPANADIAPENRPSGLMRLVTPGYFETMGIPLVEGRLFDGSDRGERPVVIVNQTLARQHFPDGNVLGQQLEIGMSESQCPCEIVGVVGDVLQTDLGAERQAGYYLPYAQAAWRGVSIVVRSAYDPRGLFPAIRQIVERHDAELAIDGLTTMSETVSATIAQPRFNAILLGSFAAVSLVLALVGVYGLMAYSVNARVPEIGLRMALGASGSRVAAGVVRQGIITTGVGVVSGTIAAFVATRFLAVMTFEVQPFDPMTVLFVTTLMILAGFLSSYLPARRASRIDPLVALRSGQ